MRLFKHGVQSRFLLYCGLCAGATFLALPGLLGTATKICACGGAEGESRQFIGAMMRAQQAHYIEAGQFASEIEALELGIPSETESNQYTMGITASMAVIRSLPKDPAYRQMVAGVFELPASEEETETSTTVVVCQAIEPGQTTPLAAPTLEAGQPQCGSDSTAEF
ncbi:MAG: hypothetical protein F6J87_30285 [Spirulina sp. SIO3F2]|nr:hypothetical protein [Spirulina sp. SIO3F2]